MRPITGLLPAVALALAGIIAGVGTTQAQTALSLPPPGTGSAEAATTPKKPAKKRAQTQTKKSTSQEDALALPGTTRSRGSDPAFATPADSKPRRFVPEEFDRDGDETSAKPYMSPSGRAGVGMRF